MDRADWGKMLFYSFCLAESYGLFGVGTFSTIETASIFAFLGVVLPFAVSYLVASHGLVYGLGLGIAPAMFAIFELPNQFFAPSPAAGVVLVLLASFLLSGLSGFAGQRLALWRDADAA
jgi:hypothetical protein